MKAESTYKLEREESSALTKGTQVNEMCHAGTGKITTGYSYVEAEGMWILSILFLQFRCIHKSLKLCCLKIITTKSRKKPRNHFCSKIYYYKCDL